MAELVAGYEGYVAVVLALLIAYMSWQKGINDGTQRGIDATLTFLNAAKAIRIVTDSDGEQHIMLPDNTPIILDAGKEKS